jgi:hypothetical protein
VPRQPLLQIVGHRPTGLHGVENVVRGIGAFVRDDDDGSSMLVDGENVCHLSLEEKESLRRRLLDLEDSEEQQESRAQRWPLVLRGERRRAKLAVEEMWCAARAECGQCRDEENPRFVGNWEA